MAQDRHDHNSYVLPTGDVFFDICECQGYESHYYKARLRIPEVKRAIHITVDLNSDNNIILHEWYEIESQERRKAIRAALNEFLVNYEIPKRARKKSEAAH